MRKTQRSFNSTIRKSGRPKKTNPARRRKEFARTLHSKARQKFVQSLPCSACGVVGYSVNAHLLGNGGMSRKGDYTEVGPLCGMRPMLGVTASKNWMGCHTYYDEHRSNFDKTFPSFDPERVAAITELAWRASLGSAPGGQK